MCLCLYSHDLCANLLELCREYQTLRTRTSSVVERAHAITVAHSDPHNPEDIRRALSQVSASVCATYYTTYLDYDNKHTGNKVISVCSAGSSEARVGGH